MNDVAIQPRVIRMKQAPAYLGMCLREFNEKVRPYVREFKIGIQGVGFVREDLDKWLDDYLESTAIDKETAPTDDMPRSGRCRVEQKGKPWHAKSAASMRGTASGTSTRSSGASEFMKALELARATKQSAT